jgi:hypothetical protein
MRKRRFSVSGLGLVVCCVSDILTDEACRGFTQPETTLAFSTLGRVVNNPSGGAAGRSVLQSTEKLVPQPQADLAFGLRTAKWLPINSSV